MTRQSVCPRGSASVVNKSRSSSNDRIEGKNIAHTRGSRPFARLHDDAINPRRWSRDPVYRLAPVPRGHDAPCTETFITPRSPAKGLTIRRGISISALDSCEPIPLTPYYRFVSRHLVFSLLQFFFNGLIFFRLSFEERIYMESTKKLDSKK